MVRRGGVRGAAAAVLAAVATAFLPAVAAAQATSTGPWPEWAAQGGGVMRHAEMTSGEWIYTNTLWMAQGANGDGLERDQYYADFAPDDPGRNSGDLRRALTYEFFGAGRSVTNGDYDLPTDREAFPEGSAEIAGVRLQVDADELFVRLEWHAYRSLQNSIATLTFGGADADVARPWPANARLRSPWELAVTVTPHGATAEPAAGGTLVLPTVVRAPPAVEIRLPLALLPGRRFLTVRGGSGLVDPAGPAYLTVPPGGPTPTRPGSGGPLSPTNVWGLLFARDEPWSFDELTQSRLLTSGDATAASMTVDLDALAQRRTTVEPVAGDLSRIYRSAYDGGDGILRGPGAIDTPAPPPGSVVGADFNVTYTRPGRLQDYAMRVPASYTPRKRSPLIVYLHGFGGTPEEPFRLPLGLVDEADRRGYLFASLQGRGDLFYRGLGELDVVEALADVQREYAVDPDRIYLMGHSMGGYGTNNIAVRLPDVFAAVAPAQGTDSVALAANLRHVPWLMVTSDFDLDRGGANAEKHYATLSALGYHATLLRYRLKIHEYSSIYDNLPRLFEHFAAHRRVVDPSTITWAAPGDGRPELGLVHEGAYWLSGVRQGSVTVRSLALPPSAGDPAQAERTVVDPSDEGGPTGRTVAILRTTRPRGGGPAPAENKLLVDISGGPGLVVDLARARLVADGLVVCPSNATGFRLGITGVADGRYEQVAAGRPAQPVTITGGRGSFDVRSTGCSTLRLGVRSAAGRPASLPATGAPAALSVVASLVLLSAVLTGRGRTRGQSESPAG
ncbi:MAG TPA: prolyl oligopeptidase family serine peptidase [Mycobacteriales bacterium]|nr:prolyl oligopeptidase family serine peptidase [Mycobacteriales bacterium]